MCFAFEKLLRIMEAMVYGLLFFGLHEDGLWMEEEKNS